MAWLQTNATQVSNDRDVPTSTTTGAVHSAVLPGSYSHWEEQGEEAKPAEVYPKTGVQKSYYCHNRGVERYLARLNLQQVGMSRGNDNTG